MEDEIYPPVQDLEGPCALSEASDETMSNVEESQRAALSVPYCQPVRLAWKDLTVSVNGGQHLVLDGVTGHAEPGRLLAIMGPSGCGKTTLVETLAGTNLIT